MNSTNFWVHLTKRYYLLILLALFTLVLAINFFNYKQNLNAEGIYVIGKVTDADFSARGTTYTYDFVFYGKKYESRVKATALGIKVGDLVFIKTLPENPNASLLVETIKVPFCFRIEDVPNDGWKELPKDTCR